jgi:hypothetical protein
MITARAAQPDHAGADRPDRARHATVVLTLLEQREKQDRERKNACDLWQGTGWVIAQPNGKLTDPRADFSDWKVVLGEQK